MVRRLIFLFVLPAAAFVPNHFVHPARIPSKLYMSASKSEGESTTSDRLMERLLAADKGLPAPAPSPKATERSDVPERKALAFETKPTPPPPRPTPAAPRPSPTPKAVDTPASEVQAAPSSGLLLLAAIPVGFAAWRKDRTDAEEGEDDEFAQRLAAVRESLGE